MERYVDKTGREINVGDVLVYDEGTGYGQSIDEVVMFNGELAALIRIGKPGWTRIEDSEPVPLRFYKLYPEHSENKTTDAKVADVRHEVAFTPEYAESVFRRQP